MKKLFIVLCLPLLVLGMASCDNKDNEPKGPETAGTEQTSPESGTPEGGESDKTVLPDEGDKPVEKPFEPTIPTENVMSRLYVDLGLSVKWAYSNYGTINSPSQVGDLVAWGAFRNKTESTWENYPYGDASQGKLDKYCLDEEYGKVDNLTTLEKADDAPASSWGGGWRMPTASEFQELIDECTWEWGTYNDMDGYLVTGPNGNSIFLSVNDADMGYYWTSELSGFSDAAMMLVFSKIGIKVLSSERISQFAIRPVIEIE